MDQDFHYYGTYYAARKGGFTKEEATLVAKAANFIDFFTESEYAAYWKLVRDTTRTTNYQVVAQLDYPRYTFQGGLFGTGVSPEDGLWCSYHFTPGNYGDPPYTPSRETVHGQDVANYLPAFATRDTSKGEDELRKYNNPSYLADLAFGKLLNRPQSALSRQLIVDAIKCATSDTRLESILGYAIGGQEILQNNREDNLRRFRLILLGVRAHVIADTWAHQDFCGISNVMNTYWDVNYDPSSWNPLNWGYGRQSIDYDDGATGGWKNKVLSVTSKATNSNFEAVPNGSSYLGHGWMGHLPDFSFVKFRYKPCWNSPDSATERNNPQEYQSAWIELVSLFTQAKGNGKLKLTEQFWNDLNKATRAIQNPCRLEGSGTGRSSSANAWKNSFDELPLSNINVDSEPDSSAVLGGMLEKTERLDRYGTDFVNVYSDLYLFQIAADYHFHFVKNYLEHHGIYRFTGSWSQQTSALSPDISNLFIDPSSSQGNGISSLIQGSFNSNFESVVLEGSEIWHVWRDNTNGRWQRTVRITSRAAGPASLIQSSYKTGGSGNLEIVVPEQDGCWHYYRDNVDGQWRRTACITNEQVSTGGCFIQSDYGGNFELLLLQAEGLRHYWRASDTGEWKRGELVSASAATESALIQSDIKSYDNHGRLDAAILENGRLWHYFRNGPSDSWVRHQPITENAVQAISGASLIQGNYRSGKYRNLELIVLERDGLWHYWCNLVDEQTEVWTRTERITAKAIGAGTLIQNRDNGNLEVVVPEADGLQHYWRDANGAWFNSGRVSI